METLQVTAILLTFTAVFLSVNTRFLKLPNTVGLMALSLVCAASLAFLQWLGFTFVGNFAQAVVQSIDLNEAVINGFLCLLLFVGALHVDVKALLQEKWAIGLLATGGVLISTFVTGIAVYLIALLIGLPLPFWLCLAFGALISPTDAVTVLSFLKGVNLPESIESKITGESLLNDGMSIVLFFALTGLAYGTGTNLILLPFALIWDIGAAIGIGIGLGLIGRHFVIHASDPYTAIIGTLALATGSFTLAGALGASGPIAVVLAGLTLGTHGEILSENYESVHSLSDFWNLVDELLNAVLFVMIGLELLAISTVYSHLVLAALAVPVVIWARYVSIAGMVSLLRPFQEFAPNVTSILTWGGLRGGISIALALSLPAGETREIILSATYFVVIFSVFVQGPTLSRLAKSQPKVVTA